jgi:glycosyl transferase family 25
LLTLQTLVISLLRSPQRREKAKLELSKTRLDWAFLDAVDGSQLTSPPEEYLPAKVKRFLGFELTANEIGCYLSHKKAWQACVDNNLPTLIFEDDFVLQQHFEQSLKILLEDFQEWELVRLQALADSGFEVIKSFGNIQVVQNHSDPLGATAYIVKPSAAKVLIAHSRYIYEPLDHFLEHYEKHHIRFLALLPYPVDISRAPTTIADRPTDRKPIKGFRKIMRSVYRSIDRVVSKDPWFPK